MTNEYATKLLKRIQYGTTYPVYEALDMAIEALKETDMGLNNGDHLHPFGEPFGWTEEEIQKHGLRELLKEVDNRNDELSCSEKPNRSEPLTDKEQRIFLAAMGRERKVCRQVDDEWRDCRESYEDSLVSVCNEIERKVKGALWTTV